MTPLEAAQLYWERGWSVIPIDPENKKPAVKWLEFQDRQPSEEEIEGWWTRWPNHGLAVITGALSGVVVVDCDNEEALQHAIDLGFNTPIRAQTRRGTHLYFLHPRDGVRRGPRAGGNSRGEDWPQVAGLDFRGDGGYAILPPTFGYAWDYPLDVFDWDDATVWTDWRAPTVAAAQAGTQFDFGALDLSGVPELKAEDYISEWDRTAKYVREMFPNTLRIPSNQGNGRNERVMRYASECIMEGLFADELRVRCHQFMREFFADPLSPSEFEATVASMEAAERRNHPERFDSKGNYVFRPMVVHQPGTEPPRNASAIPLPSKSRLLRLADAQPLLDAAGAAEYLIEPWLPRATIVQVFGYSGHGKSLFVQHAMGALAAGRKYFGPFEIARQARVLYLDWEMGPATVGRRLLEIGQVHGDTEDRLMVWTPFVDADMNLRDAAGLLHLQSVVEEARPDVVVLDTIRSAYPGLQENDAAEWGQINQLAVRLRNAGLAVIMLHHSNKPGENGIGREAGSTNQLTVLETQIRVAQVYEDKETASQKAALCDGDYAVSPWMELRKKLPAGWQLVMVVELRYGKVREWTDLHDPVQWIGWAQHDERDERMIVGSTSSKQKARYMASGGWTVSAIAQNLQRPSRLIKEWLTSTS